MKKKINSFSKKFKEDGDELDGELIKGKNKIKLPPEVKKIFKENM